MLSDNMSEVAEYFNENWSQYKNYVAQNRLCHKEMFAALEQFLQEQQFTQAFSFVDVGCGDGSSIAPVLQKYPLKKYIGIDIAEKIMQMAPANLALLTCEKQFIAEDMTLAINNLPSPIDVIFSSYTVHHLSYQEKFDFIHHCKNKLAPGGFFLMIDGILDENQTREQWLHAYEDYYREICPTITNEQLELFMHHPSSSDYPENISTFAQIAQAQNWRDFRLLLKIGLLAFMVFIK